MQRHKIKNLIFSISSIYLLSTGLVSLVFIVLGIISVDSLNITSGIFFLIGITIVLITIWVNCMLLLNKTINNRKYILMNLIICSVQSVSIFSQGFCYKYTQGFEWVGFVHIDTKTNNLDSGVFLSKLIWEFIVNFKNANGFMIGTNFITLSLAIFFALLLQEQKYFKGQINSGL